MNTYCAHLFYCAPLVTVNVCFLSSSFCQAVLCTEPSRPPHKMSILVTTTILPCSYASPSITQVRQS